MLVLILLSTQALQPFHGPNKSGTTISTIGTKLHCISDVLDWQGSNLNERTHKR